MTEELVVSVGMSPQLEEMLVRIHEQIKQVIDQYADMYLYKFKYLHAKNIKNVLDYFCIDCDKRRIMMQFDNMTISLFYLLDSMTLARSLRKCFQFDKLKSRTPNDDTISLSLSYEPCDAEDIAQDKVDRIINIEAY